MAIDVHAHYFPEPYFNVLRRHGRSTRAFTPLSEIDRRLRLMDQAGVSLQILSPANNTPYFETQAEALEAARVINDAYADLIDRLPTHFKAFVSLPLPHVDASLREIERGLDELRFAGVTIGCSVLGRSVGDEAFEPLYRELDRRHAIVFFHPVESGICSPMITEPGFTVSVGTSLEDTVVVLHMIASRIPFRYPNIRMIVPHVGGLIPMLLPRLDNQVPQVHRDLPEPPSATAQRFWYDTVTHGSNEALRCACAAFGAGHLLPGSDYPVLLPFESYTKTFSYIREADLPDGVAEQILEGNAPALFRL